MTRLPGGFVLQFLCFAALRQSREGFIAALLPGGWFVSTVMHPCFEPPEVVRFAESAEAGDHIETRVGVKVTRYLTPEAYKGIGVLGQPELQHYFHRPLHALLGAGFRAGFVVDALEEPAFAPPDEAPGPWRARWDRIPEIPRVLAVRMRLAVR